MINRDVDFHFVMAQIKIFPWAASLMEWICHGHASSKEENNFEILRKKGFILSDMVVHTYNLSIQEAIQENFEFKTNLGSLKQEAHPVSDTITPTPPRARSSLQAGCILQNSHLPERRLLSFILLPPCLGLSEFPLDSSGPQKSWGSSVPGI